jgi:hypothetical protein
MTDVPANCVGGGTLITQFGAARTAMPVRPAGSISAGRRAFFLTSSITHGALHGAISKAQAVGDRRPAWVPRPVLAAASMWIVGLAELAVE